MPDTNTPTNTIIHPQAPVGVRKVDVRRGSLDGSVSSQWFSRPDDQRFLTLDALLTSVKGRRERSIANTYSSRSIHVEADMGDPTSLKLMTPDGISQPNHWAFGQLCQRVKAPAGFLRELYTAPLVLQERLQRCEAEEVKLMRTIDQDGREVAELRAVTSPSYGRVWDQEIVEAVMNIIDDSWKVPGTINWSNGTYDPSTPVTKQSTTLYASDRDVFVFLVKDEYPIEVGKLANGDPDYMFPGVIISNSEVGSRALTLETFLMRAACENRCIWGQEGKQTLRMIHSSGLPSRFIASAIPALRDFTNGSTAGVLSKVPASKQASIGSNDDEATTFLQKMDYSKKAAKEILETVYREEGRPARSVWDIVQGITARARTFTHQDERFDEERRAGKLMEKVTV